MSGAAPSSSYLLDTQTALFALERPGALSVAARNAVGTGPNILSVVSYWEVMLKSMKGLLDVGDPRDWWTQALEQLAAGPLLLTPSHVSAVHGLPAIHKDPFDRMLIAQSIAEGLTLVSADAEIAGYSQSGLRLVI